MEEEWLEKAWSIIKQEKKLVKVVKKMEEKDNGKS